MIVNGRVQTFSDTQASRTVTKFVTAAAAHGATGIGAGVGYMGPSTLHIGFGLNVDDRSKLTWGAQGRSANAPAWLRQAADAGWNNPPAWAFAGDDSFTEDLPEDQDETHEEEEQPDDLAAIPDRFSLAVIKAAQATQRQWGVPASVTLAQWALESAYGTRMPAGSNNPFGIKAKGDQPSVTALTTEVIGGKAVKVHAAFRVFDSLDEAFILHGKLLGTAGVYANARKFINSPDRFADALTGVYATDPNYGELLKSIMRKNNLYNFDVRSDGSDILEGGNDDVARPLQRGDDSVGVETLQRRLVALGYKLGDIDGKFGSLTAAALLAFQNDNGLPTTGVVDAATSAALNTAEPRRLSDKRVKTTEGDLVAKGSTIAIDARRGRILAWISGIFGALGVGNSAIVNATNGAGTTTTAPDGLGSLLSQVQTLTSATPPADLQKVIDLAKSIAAQLGVHPIPPDVVKILDQLRQAIPPDVLTSNPDLAKVLQVLGQVTTTTTPSAGMTTILDILPTFFANDTVLQTIMKGVAAVGGSVLPGFGGSLAVLAIGLVGRYLSNRISAARVADQQTAGNINTLEP
ncbi:MAG: glucosaminidase domain-containing protein [Mesorhizobium sp.]|uniref:glucosaminidase domain-containing protein n=1 Tax=Mesorhizobium sp. TaxID=1871066 RepID=UPI001AD45F10|nr:glucosaminidase domain-containing protein [Mesorhizobium sp.]MBN9219891.1 glucosaminidase domain-containing protein [Mesorhizobium sp.]